MTDNKEVTVFGQYTKAQLLAMSGQLISGQKDFLSSLYINRQTETPTEKDAPIPAFCIDHKDKTLGRCYAEKKASVLFRPYYKAYRYEAFDPTANKGEGANAGRSIIFSDWKEEIISDNGYMKAGKDSLDKFPAGTAVKCKIVVYGTVSFDGTDQNGNPVKIVDYPVFIKLGGKRFLDYDELFKDFKKKQKLTFQYDLKLTPFLTRKGTTNYVAEIEWDNLTTEHPVTQEVIDTLQNFIDYIALENKRIENKWKRIIDKSGVATHADVVTDAADDLATDLKEPDLDDE
jgi:hypothetical protein